MTNYYNANNYIPIVPYSCFCLINRESTKGNDANIILHAFDLNIGHHTVHHLQPSLYWCACVLMKCVCVQLLALNDPTTLAT